MTRITFIENRGKTAFWAELAGRLVRLGHEVSWLVQNPMYRPRVQGQEVAVIPFPGPSDLGDGQVPDALATDRGRQYFGAGSVHYAYYEAQVAAGLDRLAPEVVIGEPTLFHELLAVAYCRDRGIPYLHPTMNRYPSGRFSILDGDTQVPAVRSGEIWDPAQLDPIVDAVTTGRSMPSYMRVPGRWEAWQRQLQRFAAQARVLVGLWRGERYNTPAPQMKWRLEQELKARLTDWKALQRAPDTDGPVILYPLQMQPEANIDVWGRPYSDQVNFVRRLLAALPPEGQVAVKANPKSKYEVSAALIELAKSERRVVLLPLDWRMPAAHEVAIGAVTVSGTVGYEAVFGRGRCVSLRHPVITSLFPDLHADTPEEAVERLIRDPKVGRGSREMTAQLIAELVSTSFPGTINEPLYDPDCLSDANLAAVTAAFEVALSATQMSRGTAA